jgi:arylsulfatase A-like enzyme
MELLEASRDQQPFFLCVDSYDPHEPWEPPQEYVDLYAGPYDAPEPHLPAYGASDYLSERELQRMRDLYAAEVTMVDRWLGRFLDRAADLKLMDNTLFVLLSDPGVGEEHGFTGKVSSELYPELVDIPFLVRHPEVRGVGRESDYFASTHEVSPTICPVKPSRDHRLPSSSGLARTACGEH